MRVCRLNMIAVALTLGVNIPSSSAAQSTLADTLDVLRAAASVPPGEGATRLVFMPGPDWGTDTTRAAALLGRLDLFVPLSGAERILPCPWAASGAPAADGGFRVTVGRPRFASADSGAVDLSFRCMAPGRRWGGFARHEQLVVRRGSGGAWRVVSRRVRSIT